MMENKKNVYLCVVKMPLEKRYYKNTKRSSENKGNTNRNWRPSRRTAKKSVLAHCPPGRTEKQSIIIRRKKRYLVFRDTL